ncbi:rhomboid-related protein 3-like [Babylonia areolata]|uniref:rhomboid-related protein 3-like n=1 Tax=Babylonia areolata TaxID=304850 RepID=UPI003FD47E42
MASLLSARRKRQRRQRPPEDEVDFHPIDETVGPEDYRSHPRRHPRRHFPTDDRAQVHGESSRRHADSPLSPYEGEPRRYEGEPRRYEGEPRRYEGEPRRYEGEPRHYEGEPRRYYEGEPRRYREEGEPARPPGEPRHPEAVPEDLEMVEMRHPERAHRPTGLYKPRYNRPVESEVVRPVRASAYSTLSVKSWSELNTEVTTIMKDLDQHFKPIFDKHGPEGVSVKKLVEELDSRRSQHLMSRESIAERLLMSDRDGDDYLSYDDFVTMITQDLKEERTLAFRGMMLDALGSIGVLPKKMRDEFLANYKICPPPLFILIISLIQVIIFVAYAADMWKRGMEVTANSGYPSYSPLPYVPRRRYEAWRYLTYMFIHDGYLHIVFNLIAQLIFGFPLEMVHGWWRTTIIYLTGVIAGSLAHSVVDPAVGLVGASGGGYAILGAHLAAVVTNWKEMNYKLCDQEEFDTRPCCALSRVLVSAPARLALVVLIVVPDTGLAIVRRVALDEDLRVGVSAHVGGFLTGLFLGIPVLKNIKKHAWETNLGWVTLVVFLVVFAFAVFFNSFFTERYPPTDWS